MMGPISRTVLVSLAAWGSLSAPVAFAAEASEPTAVAVARRQQAMRDAMHELQEARLAYSAKRYSESVERYRAALSLVPQAPATEKQRSFIKDSLSDALIAKAIDYRSVGRKDEAVEFLKEAIDLSPNNQRAQLELAHTQDAVRTNPALSPQHLADVEEVSRLLTLAYGYMDLGKYDEAIKTFHDVRKYDAYNSAAMRGIQLAQERRLTYQKSAYNSARAKALADVGAAWDASHEPDALPEEAAQQEVVTEQDDELKHIEQEYAECLGRMVLPQVIFEDASISEIIETLQNQVQRFEAEGQGASRHINIFANFGTPSSEAFKAVMDKRISFTLSDVSVRDVLELLTRQAGITYYYTPLGVELSYSGKDFGPLIERSFTVPPHFFDAEQSEDDEDDEDDAFDDSSSRVVVRRVNPVQFFKQMGISFPEGAHARYVPSTRTLHVRNTAHNIEEIKDTLNVPYSELRQIVLNVVVMQMDEKELEELGFDWLVKFGLGEEVFAGGGLSQVASMATGLPLPQRRDTNITEPEGDYLTGGLRTGSQVINQSNMDRLIEAGNMKTFASTADRKAPGIFSFRGVWRAADVAFIMRGLSQKKGMDILQNPQIILSPDRDEQVTFANVREIFYPEEYEAGELISTAGRVITELKKGGDSDNNEDIISAYYQAVMIATGSFPSSFIRYGVTDEGVGGIGTVLQVHKAQVMEGDMVKLDLTTTVNDFEGFINWGSPITGVMSLMPSWEEVQAVRDGGEEGYFPIGETQEVTLSPNYILKPIFKRHLVNTSVSLAPGGVLVFAGLKEGKKVRYEDKVPMLGDLPLVGRFFRSEGEETSHKVLIYFARVDLVDPAGRDVHTGERPTRFIDSF